MSRNFTDSQGREWKLALDPWLLTHIKDTTDVLLTKWADKNWKLADELSKDYGKLCDVLWGFCEEQAGANGCAAQAETNKTEVVREFARGMGGDTLFNAYTALAGAVTDFCLSQEQREAMELAMSKGMEVTQIANQSLLATVKEKIAAIDSNQLAKSYIATALSSQQSPESTRSPEE